jgi:predicted Zn-dependent protease
MVALWLVTLAHAGEEVLDALKAELARSQQLALPEAGTPYFVGYDLLDVQHVHIEATLGGILVDSTRPDRMLGVSVRVGSPEKDNSNFRHSGDPDGFGQSSLVITDVPAAVRQGAWLETDRAYKAAVENLARKESARRNQAPRERAPDFAPGPAHTASAPSAPPADAQRLRELARELSAVFLAHPQLDASRTWATAETGRRVMLDTGGTAVAQPTSEVDIRVIASVRSPDGEELWDHASWTVSGVEQLPALPEMRAEVERLAARLETWRQAPKEQEEWVGPVLFEGDAAVELFRRLLVPALIGTAPLETANDDFSRVDVGEGGLRLKRRVLPPGFDVLDDPSAQPALPSSYTHDHEGVPGQRVQLVEDGIVRGLLASRTPGMDVRESNGHGRGNVGTLIRGTPSNLAVTPAKVQSDRKLLKKAFALAAPYDLDHIMVVRRVADPRIGSREFRAAFGASRDERSDLPAPVELVRRYRDGREEIVRGLAFHGVDRKSLRDIEATGASTTQTLLYAGSTGNPTSGLPVTLTAPAVLLAELELVPIEATAEKPPRVLSPLAER